MLALVFALSMPILADLLKDNGCNNSTILLHCRGENKHVRGCWVLDETSVIRNVYLNCTKLIKGLT